MRLVVKQGRLTVNEFQFTEGPVYLGRRTDNQVPLPDKRISKQHAVVFIADDGRWTVEDLGSANKTYLNDEVIQRALLKNSDCIRIGGFDIEVSLEEDTKHEEVTEVQTDTEAQEEPEVQEDTEAEEQTEPEEEAALEAAPSVGFSRGPQIIIRKIGAEKAPPIRFPAERAVDFLQATEAVSKADSLENMSQVLLDAIAKQFDTFHAWCALRDQPDGAMASQVGKQRQGQAIEQSEIILNEKIDEAIEKQEFLLFIFSRDMSVAKKDQIRSTLIAPVVSPTGCFGVLYVNNTFREDHYNLGDLDYLMLLGIHTATTLENR